MPTTTLKLNNITKLFVVVLFLFHLLISSGCNKDTLSGKGFRFPLSSDPRQIDPQVATDHASVTLVAALFEGLARLDESGNPQPAAATWTVSDDGLTYTFTLVDSKWSDGTKVTAHDFVFGMQRAVIPTTNSKLAENLFIIKNAQEINQGKLNVANLGVKAVDDNTLTITLTHPDSEFPAKTATTPFMPCKKSFFDETGGRYGIEAEYVLTNGPFYLKSWSHNQSILLYKHEDYHDAENILPSSIRYVIGDVDDPITYLSEGMLDASPIPAEDLNRAEEEKLNLTIQKDTVRMLWMNNSIPALSNVYIRRSLRDSIEWKTLYQQFNSKTDIPASGFIPPDSTVTSSNKYRTSSNSLNPSTHAQDAAKNLIKGLESAELEKMPSLTLLCANDEYSTNIARYIVQSWQKNLSLYFSIETLSPSELEARVKVGNYQLALYSYTPNDSSAADILYSYRSGAIGNFSRFSDKSYDSKLSSVGQKASRSELVALESMLWQSCASVPISFELAYVGIPENNSGIIIRPFGGGPFGSPYDFRKAGKKEG
jgi:oligopeptide transport system substrate-binding protein